MTAIRARATYPEGAWVTAKSAGFCENYDYPGSYSYGSDGRSFWTLTTGLPDRCPLPSQESFTVSSYDTGSPY